MKKINMEDARTITGGWWGTKVWEHTLKGAEYARYYYEHNKYGRCYTRYWTVKCPVCGAGGH